MRHSKSYYASLEPDEAIEYLYKEIEELERRIDELGDRLDNFESERGKQRW